MDIYFSVLFYLVAGVLVNLVVQLDDLSTQPDNIYLSRAVPPFERRSLGTILLWPLFVVKLVIVVLLWLAKNFGKGLRESLDLLIGRNK